MDRLREHCRQQLRRRGFSQFEIAMELREYDYQKSHFNARLGGGSIIAFSVCNLERRS